MHSPNTDLITMAERTHRKVQIGPCQREQAALGCRSQQVPSPDPIPDSRLVPGTVRCLARNSQPCRNTLSTDQSGKISSRIANTHPVSLRTFA